MRALEALRDLRAVSPDVAPRVDADGTTDRPSWPPTIHALFADGRSLCGAETLGVFTSGISISCARCLELKRPRAALRVDAHSITRGAL